MRPRLLGWWVVVGAAKLAGCRQAPGNAVVSDHHGGPSVARECTPACALNVVCDHRTCPSGVRLVTRSLHTCLARADGTGQCWDSDDPAAPLLIRNLPIPALHVEADPASSCAAASDGVLRCWGESWGHDLSSPVLFPHPSTPPLSIRDFSNNHFACALLSDDTMHCTHLSGAGAPLQFDTSVDLRSDPAVGVSAGLVTCVLRRSGAVRCYGDAIHPELSRDGKDVDLGGRRALALSVGERHGCAVLEGNRLTCWGGNDKGALGRGHALWTGQLPLDNGAQEVQLGQVARIRGVEAGANHTCAWFEDGRLKCWGDNGDAQLGVGDEVTRGDKPGQMGEALPYVDLGSDARVVTVAAGSSSTCALLTDDRVKCWGYGYTPATPDGHTATGAAIPTVHLRK